ncbi:MAG: holo-ACP synthase [Thermoanaerobaculia bacterium]|nr:holo-ACP synthase [Thermoanaerobaculia bacterium]
MIAGIGTDIIEVQRVLEKIDKNQGFRETTFSPEEIVYCENKPRRGEHYAARFAAKEALLKAAGEGWTSAVSLSEISVLNDPAGRPYFAFKGATARYFETKKWTKIHLSIAHVREIATAMVVIERG